MHYYRTGKGNQSSTQYTLNVAKMTQVSDNKYKTSRELMRVIVAPPPQGLAGPPGLVRATQDPAEGRDECQCQPCLILARPSHLKHNNAGAWLLGGVQVTSLAMMVYALGGAFTLEAIYEKYVSMVLYSTTRSRESNTKNEVRQAKVARYRLNVGMSLSFAGTYLAARGYDIGDDDDLVWDVAANLRRLLLNSCLRAPGPSDAGSRGRFRRER